MLKVIDYNSEQVVLRYTDCNLFNIEKVTSVILYNSVEDICHAPANQLLELTGEEAKLFLQGEQKIIQYTNLINSVARLSLRVCFESNYTISSTIIDSNKVLGINVINDFANSNIIKLGSQFYNVVKEKSTNSTVTVDMPIQESVLDYNYVIDFEEFLFGSKEISAALSKDIVSLVLKDCRIDHLVEKVILYKAFKKALDCNNKTTALKLFNQLI